MKNKDPQNACEYAYWLYSSNRITAEEYINLRNFLLELKGNDSSQDVFDNAG